jgi:hypothetical protein
MTISFGREEKGYFGGMSERQRESAEARYLCGNRIISILKSSILIITLLFIAYLNIPFLCTQ